jgi:hypothetical protein
MYILHICLSAVMVLVAGDPRPFGGRDCLRMYQETFPAASCLFYRLLQQAADTDPHSSPISSRHLRRLVKCVFSPEVGRKTHLNPAICAGGGTHRRLHRFVILASFQQIRSFSISAPADNRADLSSYLRPSRPTDSGAGFKRSDP